MSELPTGWTETLIPECVYFQEGPGLRKWMFSNEGMPFLNIRTFEGGRINKSKCQHISMKEFTGKYEHFLLNEGDIVVSSSGSLGKVIEVRKEDLPVMLNTSVIRYRSLYPSILIQDYIKYYVQSPHFYKQIHLAKTGSAILNYGPSHLKEMSIVIPPPKEQKRIVEKLDTVLTQVDESKRRLDKIPVILKRFRQSVLNAAVTGELTKDWRERNTSSDAFNELEGIEIRIKNVVKEKLKFETTIQNEFFFESKPETWAMSKIGKLFQFIDYRGKTPKKSNSGKRLITAKNIRFGYLTEEPIEYVSEEYYKNWMTRGFPTPGDIFFVTEGATMGFCALNERTDEFALAQRTITLHPISNFSTKVFFYFIMSAYFQKNVVENSSGSAAVGIKASKFRNLDVPFPSVEEQKEIVKRVEALFKKADEIEERYKKAKAFVDKLTQSILAKAFRGELVPQDPNDEPAEKLLERIKAEKGKIGKEKGNRKKFIEEIIKKHPKALKKLSKG